MTDRYPSRSRLAVALSYDEHSAPRVTASGRGATADEILAMAREHGIPLEEDPALAEVLGNIELGDAIPPELYRAVAEVLAFAYILSGRLPRGFQPEPDPGPAAQPPPERDVTPPRDDPDPR